MQNQISFKNCCSRGKEASVWNWAQFQIQHGRNGNLWLRKSVDGKLLGGNIKAMGIFSKPTQQDSCGRQARGMKY